MAPASVFAQTVAEPAVDAAIADQTAPTAGVTDSGAVVPAPSPTATEAPASNAPGESPAPAVANTETPPADDTGAAGHPAAESAPVAEASAQDASQPPSDAQGAAISDDSTETERAFADIYGTPDTAQATDPNAPATATVLGTYDPWEKYNRKMHRFNNAVDRRVAKPLARGYVKVVPRPVRLGVSNFFSNLGQPVTMVNSLLQGKPKQAGQVLGRFLLNSTFGIAGIFDPASRANLPRKSEDFGQTLGVWGWGRSRYVELPLFGPRTVRDVFGMAGDAPLSPLRNVEADRVRMPLQGLQLVDMRSQLLATDSLREGAEDDYTLVRDAWSQRRDYQIFGDRQRHGEDLPDYLQEDEMDSTVPVDAMPVTVPGGG
ncbi:MAG TPA: MlaA family lipoprotein [Lysobacter sp.]|nr:MlaA family lipoprotein [Lysobacter sp.]